MSFAYSHAEHARRIAVAVIAGESISIKPSYVQARVGRTVCCARIVDAWDADDGAEMWKLDLLGPIYGRMSAPARNVRQCQLVDGRCTCAPVDMAELRACEGAPLAGMPQAREALPDGNHGEIFPECAE